MTDEIDEVVPEGRISPFGPPDPRPERRCPAARAGGAFRCVRDAHATGPHVDAFGTRWRTGDEP